MDFGTSQSSGHSQLRSHWLSTHEQVGKKIRRVFLSLLPQRKGEFVATHPGRAFPGDS